MKNHKFWQYSILGSYFVAHEIASIKKIIGHFRGEWALLLGDHAFLEALQEAHMPHKIWIPEVIPPHIAHERLVIKARQDQLPLDENSMDLVYLAHCVEFSKNPHEILRETFRVLAPEGYALITSFNPWSAWGLARILLQWTRKSPWQGHYISLSRLQDWMCLLGFEIQHIQTFCFAPPVAIQKFLQSLSGFEEFCRWGFPKLGGGYLVIAQKKVIPMTPIRPTWKTEKTGLFPGLVEPLG
jgi:SAM-dependent methyltransferase